VRAGGPVKRREHTRGCLFVALVTCRPARPLRAVVRGHGLQRSGGTIVGVAENGLLEHQTHVF
jgi:hypothetical protein